MEYSSEFIEEIKNEYQNQWPELHKALDSGSEDAIRMLKVIQKFPFFPKEIVTHNNNGNIAYVVEQAELAVRISKICEKYGYDVDPDAIIP